MGVYMGIFNFTIAVPQILSGILGGFILKYLFHNDAILTLVLAGVSMLIAAVSVSFVTDNATSETPLKGGGGH
jgi:maltose/moltooligosaccharide transporter